LIEIPHEPAEESGIFNNFVVLKKSIMKASLNSKTFLLLASAGLIFMACNKGTNSGSANLRVKLTDAPALYDSVVVYITSVEVNNDSAGGWQTLSTNSGYYDLLRLNGDDTTLVNNANLPRGYLNQMRLILADGMNYVVKDSVKTMLTLSSQDKNGLKLNLDTSVVAGKTYELLIDFDASKSIHETGNGKLKLKPVLKMVSLNEI
jgi:hypothetical protein